MTCDHDFGEQKRGEPGWVLYRSCRLCGLVEVSADPAGLEAWSRLHDLSDDTEITLGCSSEDAA